jgi:hypothetical protein
MFLSLHEMNLQSVHKPADGEPEIIPYHDYCLQPPAIAQSQVLHEFAVLLVFLSVQPLLELVQHQQHILTQFQVTASA